MYYIVDFATKLFIQEEKNKKDKHAAMSHDMLTNKVIPVPGEKKYQVQVPKVPPTCTCLPIFIVTSLIVYR